MFLPGCSTWCFLLTLHMSACGLEISGYGGHEVFCSQGLSDCSMKAEMYLAEADSDAVDVQKLTAKSKLCCEVGGTCVLCMFIETELSIRLDKDVEDEDQAGLDEMKNRKASVTVCYQTHTMPACNKVEFTVNHTALAQQSPAKVTMVITKPAGVSFGSRVMVYSKQLQIYREFVAPSLDEVCSQELPGRVEECHVPKLSIVINPEKNQVELQSADSNETLLLSVCVQYELNGRCQIWNKMTVPLYSVTPCMCFQVWVEDGQRSRRSLSCPFVNTDDFQWNVWHNVSVSVGQGQMSNYRSMLWWNLSAPCRLEGEVWPCLKESSCREMKGFRQQLRDGTWRQNSKGQWEKMGVFEDIDLQLSPCVMVEIKGMGRELGPICFNNTDRWRWSLLIVGVMLMIFLTVLTFYLLHDPVMKWVLSWKHGAFVEIGRRCHVVLLSPPDVDDGISESVSQLGSLLCNQGFSVSVDQWSRKEQCTLGPLPWLHSQLLELKDQGGRFVLVLTRKALERAEEWTQRFKETIKAEAEEDKVHPQIGSPYSDVFMASLCLIQAEKQLGRAGERFVLVRFDPRPCSDRTPPELLQGLQLFQLPSQTQALLTELTVGATGRRSSRRTWTEVMCYR